HSMLTLRSLALVGFTALAASLTPIGPSSADPSPPMESRTQVVQSLGQLPLAFEPNVGQAPPDVRYVARTARYRIGLTPTEIRLTAAEGVDRDTPTLRFRMVGAAPGATLTAEDPLPGKVHYLDDPDSSKWRRHVPTYRRIVYRGVYPGIDLVF